MTTTLAQRPQNGSTLAERIAPDEWTREYLQTIKATYGKGCTDAEFALAVSVSKATGLRIDTHELWVYKPDPNSAAVNEISIDGFYAIAHKSGTLAGIEGPFYAGKDGVYTDTWLEDAAPHAAKFIVHRTDKALPFPAVVLMREFRKQGYQGKPHPFWDRMPVHMIGVRAARHAFRKAYRAEIDATILQAESVGAHLSESDADYSPELPATEAPRQITAPAVSSEPAAPADPRRLTYEKLRTKYARRLDEAVALDIDPKPYQITDDADEETITRLGKQLDTAIASRQSELMEDLRGGAPV